MLPRARINEGLVKCNRAEAQGGPSGKPRLAAINFQDLQLRPASDSGLPKAWLLLYSARSSVFPGAVGGVVLEDTVGPPAACPLASAAAYPARARRRQLHQARHQHLDDCRRSPRL